MSRKYSLLMFLFAEALVVISVLYFGREFSTALKILYLLVFSIINYLAFFQVLVSIEAFSTDANHQVASTGIRWQVMIFYSIASVSMLLILSLAYPVSEIAQYIVQLLLILLLMIGMLSAEMSGRFSSSVAAEEHRISAAKQQLITIFRSMNTIMATRPVAGRNALEEEIRRIGSDLVYLTPSNAAEAHSMENRLVALAGSIRSRLESGQEAEAITPEVEEFKALFQARKAVYSN